MIYVYAGIGCLIIVALQLATTSDLKRLCGLLAAGREQADRARLKRDHLRARENRTRLEQEEATLRIRSLQEEIMTLTKELETPQDAIPAVEPSAGAENLKQGMEFRRSLRGGRRRA